MDISVAKCRTGRLPLRQDSRKKDTRRLYNQHIPCMYRLKGLGIMKPVTIASSRLHLSSHKVGSRGKRSTTHDLNLIKRRRVHSHTSITEGIIAWLSSVPTAADTDRDIPPVFSTALGAVVLFSHYALQGLQSELKIISVNFKQCTGGNCMLRETLSALGPCFCSPT